MTVHQMAVLRFVNLYQANMRKFTSFFTQIEKTKGHQHHETLEWKMFDMIISLFWTQMIITCPEDLIVQKGFLVRTLILMEYMEK